MGRSSSHLIIAGLCGAILAVAAGDARGQGAVPPVPHNVVAGKAYAALERGCAGCHQTGAAASSPAGGFANVLALDELAASPWLIRRGLPDASRLYLIAKTLEGHHDILNDPALPLLGPDDAQAIRDWISDLAGPDGARCRPAGDTDAGQALDYVASELARMDAATARLTRFLSLEHLGGTCGPAPDVQRLHAWLARGGGPALAASSPFRAVDPARLIWRFSLDDVGLSPETWDARIGAYGRRPTGEQATWIGQLTGTGRPIAPADLVLGAVEGSDAAGVGTLWQRPAPLGRFALEIGIAADALAARLSDVPPAVLLPARQLLTGATAARRDLDRLALVLRGQGSDLPADTADVALQVALWSDKPAYRTGETVRLSVTASADCFVTLVGVDRSGRATVLFPNEFEPNNRLPKGAVLQVPPADSAYRFRFKDPGSETFVAICSATHPAPVGIVHDYERLRFTVLGDWQLFLREPPEMREARRDDAATDTPRPNIVPRRRARGPAVKATEAMPTADDQVRTAIRVVIE